MATGWLRRFAQSGSWLQGPRTLAGWLAHATRTPVVQCSHVCINGSLSPTTNSKQQTEGSKKNKPSQTIDNFKKNLFSFSFSPLVFPLFPFLLGTFSADGSAAEGAVKAAVESEKQRAALEHAADPGPAGALLAREARRGFVEEDRARVGRPLGGRRGQNAGLGASSRDVQVR